jgi:hypothetical protein
MELHVFRPLQFGEAGWRELATTEFFTTPTIAISVLSDHGGGGWKTIQTGAELARGHGCCAFSKAVNLASMSVISSTRGRHRAGRVTAQGVTGSGGRGRPCQCARSSSG